MDTVSLWHYSLAIFMWKCNLYYGSAWNRVQKLFFFSFWENTFFLFLILKKSLEEILFSCLKPSEKSFMCENMSRKSVAWDKAFFYDLKPFIHTQTVFHVTENWDMKIFTVSVFSVYVWTDRNWDLGKGWHRNKLLSVFYQLFLIQFRLD